MSRALIVTPEAEADILDGYRSYEDKQNGLGVRFVDEIEQSLARIAPNPLQYQEVEPDIRRTVVHTFPYLVFYTFDPEFDPFDRIFVEGSIDIWEFVPGAIYASRIRDLWAGA